MLPAPSGGSSTPVFQRPKLSPSAGFCWYQNSAEDLPIAAVSITRFFIKQCHCESCKTYETVLGSTFDLLKEMAVASGRCFLKVSVKTIN